MEKKTSCLLCVLTALLLAVISGALPRASGCGMPFCIVRPDGSFSGKDAYAAYTQIAQTGNGAEVDFTLDGETRHYRLESKVEGMSDPGVKIEQDGVVAADGRGGRRSQQLGKNAVLHDEPGGGQGKGAAVKVGIAARTQFCTKASCAVENSFP